MTPDTIQSTEYQCDSCGAVYEDLRETNCLWLSNHIQTFTCVKRTGYLRLICGGLVHGVDHRYE